MTKGENYEGATLIRRERDKEKEVPRLVQGDIRLFVTGIMTPSSCQSSKYGVNTVTKSSISACTEPPSDTENTRLPGYKRFPEKEKKDNSAPEIKKTTCSEKMTTFCEYSIDLKKCLVHNCKLVRHRVSATKWTYIASKKCYGYAKKSSSRWVCNALSLATTTTPCEKPGNLF